jgi:hydroxymethylpyrimidine pyrophosphatase-like HAD family hydrolase
VTVIALDLDQTLIYSTRSAGPLDVETVWVEDYDGAPLSLMTAIAHARLADLQARHHVVPVTTRTPEQFGRVRLPVAATWAVTCNGGVLLHDGVRDAAWDRRVGEELRTVAPASEARVLFDRVGGEPWVRSHRQVEDLFVYLVAKDRDAFPADWLAEVADWAQPRGWGLSVQGRKAYAVPTVLSKGAAARRVADLLGGPLLAAGDSLLDRDLLEVADAAVRPPHGELELVGYDGVPVTGRPGARAAEDVLAALGELADGWGHDGDLEGRRRDDAGDAGARGDAGVPRQQLAHGAGEQVDAQGG